MRILVKEKTNWSDPWDSTFPVLFFFCVESCVPFLRGRSLNFLNSRYILVTFLLVPFYYNFIQIFIKNLYSFVPVFSLDSFIRKQFFILTFMLLFLSIQQNVREVILYLRHSRISRQTRNDIQFIDLSRSL